MRPWTRPEGAVPGAVVRIREDAAFEGLPRTGRVSSIAAPAGYVNVELDGQVYAFAWSEIERMGKAAATAPRNAGPRAPDGSLFDDA